MTKKVRKAIPIAMNNLLIGFKLSLQDPGDTCS